MTNDTDREAFEAWYRGYRGAPDLPLQKDIHGEYLDDDANPAWAGYAAALANERAKTAWRPIETAPKNGDPILIGCDRTQSIRWAVWSDGFWRDGQASVGGRIAGVPNPTHWRPLPELPK